MPESDVITARVGGGVHDRIQEYADRRSISVSKAVSELVDAGIDLTPEGDGDQDARSIPGETEVSPVLEEMQSLQSQLDDLSADVSKRIEAQRRGLEAEMVDHFDMDSIDSEQLRRFADKPFNVLSKGEPDSNEYYVTAPRFVPFHVGHLLEQDEAWNTFVINKYVSWIEDIPTPIREQIDIEKRYEKASVDTEERLLRLSDEEERDRAWDDLGGRDGGLLKRVGDDAIQIKKGSEFDVIAKLVENGNLPFEPIGPEVSELRTEPSSVSLRPYQERAWEEFVEYGQVGVYWPPGLGKTFFALYAGQRISGEKLVVVPSSTLEHQWEERINEFVDQPSEWTVKTYQYLTHGNNINEFTGSDAPTLTVFDENHALPATTYSTLSTIGTDYRLGLSATPYREDDRTDYVFALTGIPVGIEWQELQEFADFEYPEVTVYLYRTQAQKRADIESLVGEPGETLVFCDSIDAGNELSDALDVPFVHGETPKSERMSVIEDHRVVIGSRVADEGMSLDSLDRIIEYDFHGSSRRQELQRAGRLMHMDDVGDHIIQMTDEEYESYGKRLYSLEEKGMDIEFIRRA